MSSSNKVILARIKKQGSNFEISVNSDKALDFKQGKIDNVSEALEVEDIFTDAKKGLKASEQQLTAAFNTTNILEIAAIIINKGEIQLSAEHRKEERQKKQKKLVHMIHSMAVDSKTDLPHPVARIEAALTQAKATLLDHKTIEEQFDDIIKKLRPILPIKISKKLLYVVASAQHVGKLSNYIRGNLTIKKEEWTNDGHWATLSEAPAGLVPEIVDKINGITGGDASIDIRDE